MSPTTQTSAKFCDFEELYLDCKTVRIFAYSNTREQSNKRSGMRLKTESEVFFLSPHTPSGRVRLARFARVRLSRDALPISLLILRKKPTVLQSSLKRLADVCRQEVCCRMQRFIRIAYVTPRGGKIVSSFFWSMSKPPEKVVHYQRHLIFMTPEKARSHGKKAKLISH